MPSTRWGRRATCLSGWRRRSRPRSTACGRSKRRASWGRAAWQPFVQGVHPACAGPAQGRAAADRIAVVASRPHILQRAVPTLNLSTQALLLQMVSGVTRSFPDGMKLRGDIHICLMGDPGARRALQRGGSAGPAVLAQGARSSPCLLGAACLATDGRGTPDAGRCGQEPAAEARGQGGAARGLHHRQGLQRRRPDGGGAAQPGDQGAGAGGRRPGAGGPRHLLHRRV
jgi:hypothetical protein